MESNISKYKTKQFKVCQASIVWQTALMSDNLVHFGLNKFGSDQRQLKNPVCSWSPLPSPPSLAPPPAPPPTLSPFPLPPSPP